MPASFATVSPMREVLAAGDVAEEVALALGAGREQRAAPPRVMRRNTSASVSPTAAVAAPNVRRRQAALAGLLQVARAARGTARGGSRARAGR